MIRLLIDENLPASLGAVLPVDAVYATDFGPQPTDHELWSMARVKDLTILTRDADFFDRIIIEGPPPKVIWVRLGNVRRTVLEKWLVEVWPDIEKCLQEADLIEIHPNAIETFTHPRH